MCTQPEISAATCTVLFIVCRFIGVCVNEGQVHALVEVSRVITVETSDGQIPIAI